MGGMASYSHGRGLRCLDRTRYGEQGKMADIPLSRGSHTYHQLEFRIDTTQARAARVALDWNSKKAGRCSSEREAHLLNSEKRR